MIKVKIKFLRPFSEITGKSKLEIDIDGQTLTELLKLLVNRYPKLEKEFFTNKDDLTEYICIFVNDKPISALNGLDTELKNGDNLLFFIPVSGG